MRNRLYFGVAIILAVMVTGSCNRPVLRDTAVVVIESSPANLDPRVGTDAQSERIGKLLFDSLLRRDDHFNLQPSIAERWEIPNPVTYIFHLRHDVHFHNGQPLTSRDVKWTFDTLMNGSVISAKASTYKQVESIDAPDPWTVIFHLKNPFATLLWNVGDGAIGIVPYGSDKEFNRNPVGSGPFKFVSAVQDSEVIVERNETYWGGIARIPRIRFAVVPDATTRALELRKGSADAVSNALTADMVVALKKETNLVVESSPGTIYAYVAFNLRDPILKDVRVRQAIAYAIDRQTIIHYLWRDQAMPAPGILPTQHWAFNPNVRQYDHDPVRANKILDDAGYALKNGIRFHITMKTSTEETTRLLAAVFQQQLREVGIALEIRSYEFATFYSDVVKGAFQFYSLRWIGGNEDPDIFEHVFHSASFPPKRANRSFYVNLKVDELIDRGRTELDQEKRRTIYFELQEILAEELPYINLFYVNNVVIHSKRLQQVHLSPSGNYDFLRSAELVP